MFYLTGIFLAFVFTSCGISNVNKQDNKNRNPMYGVWSNNTRGDIVGIEIINQTECQLFIERLLKPRTIRACKYEAFEEVFLIFLVQENGLCGQEADFEFRYYPETTTIHLYTGHNPILLTKENF